MEKQNHSPDLSTDLSYSSQLALLLCSLTESHTDTANKMFLVTTVHMTPLSLIQNLSFDFEIIFLFDIKSIRIFPRK